MFSTMLLIVIFSANIELARMWHAYERDHHITDACTSKYPVSSQREFIEEKYRLWPSKYLRTGGDQEFDILFGFDFAIETIWR